MSSKKYIEKTIKYTVAILVVIAIIMIVIDPFTHYHMPYFGMGTVATDERTSLVGIAKHDYYETALIGSSMSENFVDSWFEYGSFGTSADKFCLQGAHFDDYEVILDEVIKHPELKNIVFCLDNYILTDDPSEQEVTIPEYLSNDSIFDDAKYLWNRGALCELLPVFIINNIKEHGSDDNAYVWENLFPYGEAAAVMNYATYRPDGPKEKKEYDYFFENADLFLSKFERYIKARPDVKFIIYWPPYSALFWDYSKLNGDLEAEICMEEKVCQSLLSYENVEIYYFQDDFDTITNLDNYRDYSHYKQAINYKMYKAMRDGSTKLTNESYYDRLLSVYEFGMTYDAESVISKYRQ